MNISETIERLKELEKKASIHPWDRTNGIRQGGTVIAEAGYLFDVKDDPNLDFIVALRNAFPALLAEIERLEKDLESAYDALNTPH